MRAGNRRRRRAVDLLVRGHAAVLRGRRERQLVQRRVRPDQARLRRVQREGLNGRFIADGLKAYTQAVLYVLTGKEVYRENALGIIRIWEQMDPAKYEYHTDSHIYTGIPLFRMVSAAELLRYTSCGEDEAYPWTDADPGRSPRTFRPGPSRPSMSAPDHFMNQHNYPLMGSMAGAIFMDDTALYEREGRVVHRQRDRRDEGFNGSIARLFRWVDTNDKTGEPIDDPHVQHVEMGRDQAHGGGDLTNFAVLARMLLAQDTEGGPGRRHGLDRRGRGGAL